MALDEGIGAARQGVTLAGELIKAAGDDPNVKAAGHELGEAALTVAKCINNALLPIAAVNYGFDKAREYFANKFQSDMASKAAYIPSDRIVEPKPSIAGPALEGLAFSHDEPNLREMYLSLLASAMDGRASDEAHPAFAEIIRQLTSAEAAFLRVVLKAEDGVHIAEARLGMGGTNFRVLYRHLLDLRDPTSDGPVEDANLPAMVDNWIRLGLVEVPHDTVFTDDDAYDDLERRPEVQRLRAEHETEDHKLSLERGVLRRTALGLRFARVVGLLDDESAGPEGQPPT